MIITRKVYTLMDYDLLLFHLPGPPRCQMKSSPYLPNKLLLSDNLLLMNKLHKIKQTIKARKLTKVVKSQLLVTSSVNQATLTTSYFNSTKARVRIDQDRSKAVLHQLIIRNPYQILLKNSYFPGLLILQKH